MFASSLCRGADNKKNMQRTIINRKCFTKSERRFAELLKAAHIHFRTKIMVCGREIDFIVGKYAIEIDGHLQDGLKNEMLAKEGYIPIHISNMEVKDFNIEKLMNKDGLEGRI